MCSACFRFAATRSRSSLANPPNAKQSLRHGRATRPLKFVEARAPNFAYFLIEVKVHSRLQGGKTELVAAQSPNSGSRFSAVTNRFFPAMIPACGPPRVYRAEANKIGAGFQRSPGVGSCSAIPIDSVAIIAPLPRSSTNGNPVLLRQRPDLVRRRRFYEAAHGKSCCDALSDHRGLWSNGVRRIFKPGLFVAPTSRNFAPLAREFR